MSAEGLPEGWPEGTDRVVLTKVDSTNAEAARRAPGLTRPTWIMALRQSAARGRRGRPWLMAEGNFAATLSMPLASPPAEAALRSFVAALALHEALAGLTGERARLTLKWPNDVILNGGKVAGILLESAGRVAQLDRLAVGIGVNLVAAPGQQEVEAGALFPVSVLGETGRTITPGVLLTPLAAAFARWEARLSCEGFPPLRDAFLSRAGRIGETVTARTGAGAVEGRFETIDDTGALVLSTANGPRAIPAADLYFQAAG
ncbi:MAG: biotin--[acetyl-CoA-carboxylase] ligase [Paracoccaceae bacterium]